MKIHAIMVSVLAMYFGAQGAANATIDFVDPRDIMFPASERASQKNVLPHVSTPKANTNRVSVIVAFDTRVPELKALLQDKPFLFHQFPRMMSQDAQKNRQYDEILSLAKHLNAIVRSYLPKESLDEQDEKSALLSAIQSMHTMDQARRLYLSDELDKKINAFNQEQQQEWDKKIKASRLVKHIEQGARKLGARGIDIQSFNHSMSFTIAESHIGDLKRIKGIQEVIVEPPIELELDTSIPSSGFEIFWDGPGIDGAPWDIGISDSQIVTTHPTFNGAQIEVRPGHSSPGTSGKSHGTHVAGIALGRDDTYKGGAPGATLFSAPSGFTGVNWLMTKETDQADVVNTSWGSSSSIATSDYTSYDQQFDKLVYNQNILMVKSAGNKGWHDTQNTVTRPGAAYNIITVANMDDRDTQDRSDDVRRASSSVGPTPDNRRKPDISAPGTNILSANYLWATGDDFVSKSGTSMAAPHVTAAVALISDAGIAMRPMSQKALLINTADAWTSSNTRTTTDDGPIPGSYWDRSYGWGYLDMTELFYHTSDVFQGEVVAENDTSEDDDYKLFAGKMKADEKSTLVWQRRFSDSGALQALTNLNLKLFDEETNYLVSSDFKKTDNVHQVSAYWDMEAVVKVYTTGEIAGADKEVFALATEEYFRAVPPPSFQLEGAAVTAKPGDTVQLPLKLINTGGVRGHDVKVSIYSTSTHLIPASDHIELEHLAASESHNFILSVTIAGGAKGKDHTLNFTVLSQGYGESFEQHLQWVIKVVP